MELAGMLHGEPVSFGKRGVPVAPPAGLSWGWHLSCWGGQLDVGG